MPKENREMGWKLIDVKMDYQRMGIPNDYWEITDANKDYEVIFLVTTALYNISFCFSEKWKLCAKEKDSSG